MEAVNKHKSLILVIFNIELEVEFFIVFLFILQDIMCVHAKLLQLCPTLGEPVDCSLPDSSVRGIL